MILNNADKEHLRNTGNFVVTDPCVIKEVTAHGLWQLQCFWEQRPSCKDWPKIKEEFDVGFHRTHVPSNIEMLSLNGVELSETWPEYIHLYQLQSLKRKTVSDQDLSLYISLWIDLVIEEKTRQRVCKEMDYNFGAFGMNLPWAFDTEQGYKTLPIVIWLRKVQKQSSQESSSASGSGQPGHVPEAQAWPQASWHTGSSLKRWQVRDSYRR